ncbi:hypothetical protein COCNU_06G006110 [Cocos nucifera]|uniref:Uncharacterized protein n=1 Tax=Cocos nucifera TaxID=13894 RepID=A0A8K0IBG0_COCNU|nr:hypothetical protein COCNU_06G006110 [Cocos nucifera]
MIQDTNYCVRVDTGDLESRDCFCFIRRFNLNQSLRSDCRPSPPGIRLAGIG